MFGIDDALMGSIVAGGLGFLGGERTNSANAGLAQRQMNFQADMSGTSYQRAVQDLKKAGLNPMLAYTNGGASSPAGAAAVMGDSVSSGVSGYQKTLERKLMEEQIRVQKAAANKTEAETRGIDFENNLNWEFGERLRWAELANKWGVGEMQSAQTAKERALELSYTAGVEKNYEEIQQIRKIVEELDSRIKLNLTSAEKNKISKDLLELDLPKARNLANAEDSFVKRNISPYLEELKLGEQYLGDFLRFKKDPYEGHPARKRAQKK